MTLEFQLEGQEFVALNGGPVFAFSQAISFVVNCRTQKGDRHVLGTALGRRGTAALQPCGWLKDKYGIPWQVVPAVPADMLSDPDPEKSRRVMKAMLRMGKLDIGTLQKACDVG